MKVVGVTLPIYLLCRELERLEDSEYLNFSVFYPFSAILESHHYCPGFEVEGVYYEVQYNSNDELILLEFNKNALLGDLGHPLSNEDVMELVERLKEI